MYYIIINDNKDIIILKNCRSVETYINSLDYKEHISHTSVSRRLRNENVINFKDLQIYSSDSLDKYIVVDKEKQTICFLENLRSIEEYIKEIHSSSPSYITLSRRLKEEGIIYIKHLLIKEIK